MQNECVRCGREIVLDAAALLLNDNHETADFDDDFFVVLLYALFDSRQYARGRR
jgi:hypothetical protein